MFLRRPSVSHAVTVRSMGHTRHLGTSTSRSRFVVWGTNTESQEDTRGQRIDGDFVPQSGHKRASQGGKVITYWKSRRRARREILYQPPGTKGGYQNKLHSDEEVGDISYLLQKDEKELDHDHTQIDWWHLRRMRGSRGFFLGVDDVAFLSGYLRPRRRHLIACLEHQDGSCQSSLRVSPKAFDQGIHRAWETDLSSRCPTFGPDVAIL
jgi:hypothetical protein